MHNMILVCILTCSLSFCLSNTARGADGNFSTLTWNIAGLPEFLSSAESNRLEATKIISCYVNQFDFVNVQEDFNYHAALYDTCNDHPYRSSTTGGAGIGSGLNSLSRFPYMDWTRIRWEDCNGVDCLTPKGFTMARTRLAEGVYVDIYNLHAQAEVGETDLAVRRANILQLSEYIKENSAGNAVIVMGDTNTRYTRPGDNIRELLQLGFVDVWSSLIRSDSFPEAGDAALVCDPAVASSECEVVDKVFYRDNGYVGLSAVSYDILQDAKNDAEEALSDHPPIRVEWTYQTPPDRRLSDQFGGPYGKAFNDIGILPQKPTPTTLSIRSGSRVDKIEIVMSDGTVLSHGGTGGSLLSLSLTDGEFLSSVDFCRDKYNDKTRIFYTRFSTSLGQVLSGGSITSDCETITAPDGWQIVGFHGRAGDELDKVGVIFSPCDDNTQFRVTE